MCAYVCCELICMLVSLYDVFLLHIQTMCVCLCKCVHVCVLLVCVYL